METLRRGLDERFDELRRGSLLREHGWTMAFASVGLVALRFLSADWSRPSFADRLIGVATLADVDIAARGGVFAQCLVLFVASLFATGYVAPRVARALGHDAWRAVEGTSAAGLILILLATWRVQVTSTLVLVGIAQGLVVLTTWLDRVTRAEEIRERGAYVGWLVATGFALGVPVYDVLPDLLPKHGASFPLAILAGALALDVARRAAAWIGARGATSARADARASSADRILHALTPLSVLAAAPVARNEVYFLCNQWGWLTIKPDEVEAGLVALVLAWCGVRAWRGAPRGDDGRLDLERTIGRFTFPWIVGGVVATMRFIFDIGPSPDFFEPGNAGLMIQQWFDFGRLPFFETFSAHGLADSFFGFVYAAVTGFRDESWGMYDYGYPVLGALVAFHVVRAWFQSANAAVFFLVSLPFLNFVFPAYCVHVAVSVFVVAWVYRRRTTLAWALFTLWCAFVFVWRLDMGFANAIASGFALVGAFLVLPEHRPALGAMLRGAAVAVVGMILVYVGVCLARGIDPIALLLDFKAVVSSNQAFGFEVVAHRRTEIVMNHVFVVPIAVTLVTLAMYVRMRGRVDRGDPAYFAVIATGFFAAYYFANYPRGLVRHSFLEGANSMLSSFALLVLAGSCRWWMPHARRVTAFTVFCGLVGVLGFNLDIEKPDGREVTLRAPTIERLPDFLRGFERVRYSRTVIDRSQITPWFGPRNTDEILPFLAREVGPAETFLDLSNSPMLYFHARKPSPHWLNHLLIVCGDRLQEQLIAGLARYDLPFVILSALPERAQINGMPALGELDGVSFAWRHYKIREWVYRHYDPLTAVGRWSVWIRRDRLLAREPAHESRRRLFSSSEARSVDDGAVEASSNAPAANWTVKLGDREPVVVPGRVLMSPDKSYVIRFAGRTDTATTLGLEMTFQSPHGVESLRRELVFPAGDLERWYRVPSQPWFRTLKRLEVAPRAGLELRDVELAELESADGAAGDQHVHQNWSDELRYLPLVWGTADARRGSNPPLLRDLLDPSTRRIPRPLVSARFDESPWKNGILTTKTGFLRDASCRDAPVAVGETLVFAHGGDRKVTEVRGAAVFVEGPLLDPVKDGAPALVRRSDWAAPLPDEDPTVLRAGRRFVFDPLESCDDGTYLVLRMRRLDPTCNRLVIDYGRGENGVGRFVLGVAPDDEMHEYRVRLSTQYNWTHRPNEWILLSPEGGGLKLERLWLAAGD